MAAALALYHGQYHLNIAVVAAIANHNVNRLSSTGNGVADGLALRVVFLAVDSGCSDFAVGFHRDGGTLARRNGELGAAIQLCPVVPVAVGKLTAVVGVEVGLHVDGLAVDGGLAHPNACLVLIGHSGSTVLTHEVELHGDRLRTVGQLDLVGSEDGLQLYILIWYGVLSAGGYGVGTVGPAGQGLALNVHGEVLGQGDGFAHLLLDGGGNRCSHCLAGGKADGSVALQVGGVDSLNADEGAVAVVLDGQRGTRSTFIYGVADVALGITMPAVGIAHGQCGYVASAIGDGAVLCSKLAVAKTNLYRTINGNGERAVHPSVLGIVESGSTDSEVGCGIVGCRSGVRAVLGHLYTEVHHVGCKHVAIGKLNGKIAESVLCFSSNCSHTTEHDEQTQ